MYALPLAGTQNSERVKCVEYKLLLCVRPRTERWNAYTKRDIENPNEYLRIINFRTDHTIKTSTQHPYIHSPVPNVCVIKEKQYKYNNKRTENINIHYLGRLTIVFVRLYSSVIVNSTVNSTTNSTVWCWVKVKSRLQIIYNILKLRDVEYMSNAQIEERFSWLKFDGARVLVYSRKCGTSWSFN